MMRVAIDFVGMVVDLLPMRAEQEQYSQLDRLFVYVIRQLIKIFALRIVATCRDKYIDRCYKT